MSLKPENKEEIKKRGKYDDKLQVKEGSFIDIIAAAMKHANNNSAKGSESEKKDEPIPPVVKP